MENGFSSPRSESFPAGLRVLVVDDDPTWLKILEKMLKKCFYEVTTCGLARDALTLLRERKDGYDIVISDVNMPDMDGFKLLEHVGLEMDLPVIMMSVDGETSRVMKGVQHGACDYLLKPIRMKELRNIWQHVFRKKIHEIRDIESYDTYESIQISRNGSDLIDDGHMFSGEDLTAMKKRKDFDNKHDDKDFGDPTATKKHRVVWSVDLHQKFVKAVNQIGFDKVGPKKILDLMNVPWLTRENVASHLQKYRLYLSRLQKENDLKASFGGVKHSELPSKDFVVQNSNDVANGRYQFGNNLVGQNLDIKSHEGDIKGIVSDPVAEPNRADVSDPQKTSSQMSFDSFTSLESEGSYAAYDCTPPQYGWTTVQEIQLEKEDKPHLQLEDGFRQLPQHGPLDQIQSIPSIVPLLSLTGVDTSGSVEIKSNHLSHVSPTGSAIESISTPISSMRPQGFNLCCIPDVESFPRNLISANESSLAPFNEDWTLCWLQGDYNMNFEFTDCPGFIAGVPIEMASDYEWVSDTTEYPFVDQGLFT